MKILSTTHVYVFFQSTVNIRSPMTMSIEWDSTTTAWLNNRACTAANLCNVYLSSSLLSSDSSELYVSTALGDLGKISFSSYNTTDGVIIKSTQVIPLTGTFASYDMKWHNNTHILVLIGYTALSKLSVYDTATESFVSTHTVPYVQTTFIQGDTRDT